jgi:TusA-related sulfurtransferase
LRAVKCPLNFVKAKLALEKLPDGSRLEIWLAPNLGMDVINSLRQEGYTLQQATQHAGYGAYVFQR